MNLPAVIFFCLVTGGAMGALYLLLGVLRAMLGAGKLLTFFIDLVFCCLCSAAVFLCALAVGKGRLRAVQVLFQLLGGWAVVVLFAPFVGAVTRLLQKIFWKLTTLFRKFRAFLKAHFRLRREKGKENRRKTAKKQKKSVKSTCKNYVDQI